MAHALCDAKLRHFWCRQGEIDQLNAPVSGLQPTDQSHISAPGQRRLEAEVIARLDVALDLVQEQPPSRYSLAFWCQRRYPGRDQVCVHEIPTTCFGKILQGKRRLPGAIGPRDDPALRPGWLVHIFHSPTLAFVTGLAVSLFSSIDVTSCLHHLENIGSVWDSALCDHALKLTRPSFMTRLHRGQSAVLSVAVRYRAVHRSTPLLRLLP